MKMQSILNLATAAAVMASPALADGDIAAGEATFGKCKSCHGIIADDGTVIQRGGKVGPNLFGIVGRAAGTFPEFKYGDDLVAAGVAGLVWDEVNFLAYVQDPKAFLKEYLQSDTAKSKMTFKLAAGGEDVLAYLASIAPQ